MSCVPVSKIGGISCSNCRAVSFGAEILVLEGKEGGIGVDGSSEADGDGDKVAERSPARAANSGRAARRSRVWGRLDRLGDPEIKPAQRGRRCRSSSRSWAEGELSHGPPQLGRSRSTRY